MIKTYPFRRRRSRPPDASGDIIRLLNRETRTRQVRQLSQGGARVALYRADTDGSYVLTSAQLLPSDDAPDTTVRIPCDEFDALMSQSREFRAVVFEAYSNAISDLSTVIQGIASASMGVCDNTQEEDI